MRKKLLPSLIALGVIFIAGTAHAAKGGKSGLFVGVEGDYDSVNYTHYVSYAATDKGVSQDPAVAPYTSTGNHSSGYLVLGQRFYINDKIGFGLKGFGGYGAYDNKSIYQPYRDQRTGDFISKAEAVTLGVEVQMYIDLLAMKSGSIGINVGGGYELTQFYNVSATTDYNGATVTEIENYSDNSWIADAGLHYQLGDRNRIEMGYRIKNYNKTASFIRPAGDNFRTVGFNVNSAIYLNYTFSF